MHMLVFVFSCYNFVDLEVSANPIHPIAIRERSIMVALSQLQLKNGSKNSLFAISPEFLTPKMYCCFNARLLQNDFGNQPNVSLLH